MTQDSTQKVTKSATPSWWVWLCWSEHQEISGFVYGCAAHCFRPPEWADSSEINIPNSGKLKIRQLTLKEEGFQAFRDALNSGVVKIEILLEQALPEVAIRETRQTIQNGLGHTAAKITAYYTLPDILRLLGNSEDALINVLCALEDQLNLPFKSSYAARLGNFELFELNPWLDRPPPFLIEVVSGSNFERTGPHNLEICRTPEFASERHIAHIVGRVYGDVVIDRLIMLEPDIKHIPVISPEKLDQIDFWLFNDTGDTLLHSEKIHFFNQLSSIGSIVGKQINLEDDVSKRATHLGIDASSVYGYSSHRSLIGASKNGSWRKFAQEINHTVAVYLPSASQDKWFPHGIEGELGVIAHMNYLLHGGQVHRAVLVDPWFGVHALRRFALRLESQDVEITIITSWIDIDPDTGNQLNVAESQTNKLESELRRIKLLINPNLKFINITDGKKQAFHDRYLLIYLHEEVSKVFLLSNSLNKASGDWPFSMSLLAADVSLEVRKYIEGLCEGKDIARGKQLTITFKWSANV